MALEISQPSVSRALMAAGDRVAHIGRARRARYAALRDGEAVARVRERFGADDAS
jgi:hypothetical protein